MFPALGQGIEKGPPPLAKVEPGVLPSFNFFGKKQKKGLSRTEFPCSLVAAEAREELIRGMNGLWLDCYLY